MKFFRWSGRTLASLFWVGTILGAEPTLGPEAWFKPNPEWAVVANATMAAGAPDRLETTAGADGKVLVYTGKKAESVQLRTRPYLGDCILSLEFLLPAGSSASVFLEGRYAIRLDPDAMGALAPQEEATGADAKGKGVPALVKVTSQPGQWQTFEAKLRTPRFDEAHNKLDDALLLEVRINGQVVQSNTVARSWSVGTELRWHDEFGESTVAVQSGSLALRNFSVRRADFGDVKVPEVSGQPTNTDQLVDFVKLGAESFRGFGCVECHAVQADDTSAKTGPNLFGLFTLAPRDRVVATGGEGHRFTVKANRTYLYNSLRTPIDQLAIAERGPTQGQPYPPVMPPFHPAVLSDKLVDAIGSYLATLNPLDQQGPVVRLMKPTGMENYDPMTDRLQLLVDQTVRLQRGPMPGVSGRAVHVGLPNGLNYSFDPRVLGIAKLWQGGFLDMTGEWLNRGGSGLKTGFESREIALGAAGVLLVPLKASGQPVDFTFKEPVFQDDAAVRAGTYNSRDHLALLAEADAQFLGYTRNSADPLAAPVFNYRVGRNTVSLQTNFAADGTVTMTLGGEFATPQNFAVNEPVLGSIAVSAGTVQGGKWTLPAGKHSGVTATGRLALAPDTWHAKPSSFNFREQALVVEAATPKVPAGYRSEVYLSPKDNYGRDQLFEPLGMAVAPDGTIVVATRTAGIWRLKDGRWHLFAEGLFDSLGVVVEDEHGLTVVAGQKAELTRLRDTNGDGLADTFTTLTDAFSYTGNYHAYLHGPVPDGHGGYFATLNLADAGGSPAMYNAGGKYMGTTGGYRGWAFHWSEANGFEPWASGLRSPAGLGVDPQGGIWYADNQGEYVGTSKIFRLKRDAFYGHPASLIDRSGMTPDSPEIAWDRVLGSREPAVILLPQSRLANSPGNPVWDTAKGKFGPYAGQLFIGDQTQSVLMRVVTEKVGDHEQGVAIPFAADLESGVMRPVFLPDGSLLLGQTGRGWQAKGGRVASLQRLIWDGKTVAPAIHHVAAVAGGFELTFTQPVPAELVPAQVGAALKIKSWVYRDAPDYGSPELDEHVETLTAIEVAGDRRTVRVTLAKTEQPRVHPQQTARVYQLSVDGQALWHETNPSFEAFYTLYAFPAGK